jgi:putative FmdB family regulatory protein
MPRLSVESADGPQDLTTLGSHPILFRRRDTDDASEDAMPLYEYRCRECDHRYDRLERIDAPTTGTCPECGGETSRQIGVPALQFKGSGWYVTDYGKGTGGAPGEAPKKKDNSSKDSESKSSSSSSSDSSSSKNASPKSDSSSSTASKVA